MLKILNWDRFELLMYIFTFYIHDRTGLWYVCICVHQCSIINGDVSLPNTRSIYSLVTISSDKLVTRCSFRARFMLVVIRGFNICWEKVVGMTTCATLVLGCPGYTRASEYIYTSTFHWESTFSWLSWSEIH